MATRTVTLALEGSAEVEAVAIDHEELRSNLLVSVRLPSMIDAETANLAAAHFIEQDLDLKPDRIKIVNLRFRDRGAAASLSEFLSQFSSSVIQLSLKDVHTDANSVDAEAFEMILSSLLPKTSKIEVLNLSQNTLPPSIWRNVGNCRCLRKLLLDHVFLEARSVREFTAHVPTSSLEDFYLVLVRPPGDGESAMEACDFVAKCTNLLSLRWAHLQPLGCLPWAGLRMLSTQSFRLRHLILDGSMISVGELGNDGLCGALRQLLQLRTLKLRDVGLRDNGAKGVVAALKIARPPLEWFELSGNQIEDASCIADLVHVEKIISVLDVVSLERNSISFESVRILMEAFGPIQEVDLRLDSSLIDFRQVALDILRKNSRGSDSQQKTHYEDTIQTLSAENAAMSEEILRLQKECKNLRIDRGTLIEAFSIMGVSRQVEEQRRTVERITHIEERLGLSRNGSDRSGSFRVPPCLRSSLEPSTPQSESTSVGIPNSRGSVLSGGSEGSRRRLITRDDQSQTTTSRSGTSTSGRQLSPAPAFLSPGASSATAIKRGIARTSSSDNHRFELMMLADTSDSSTTPPVKPVYVRSVSRKSLMGNDLESVPDVEIPSAQRRVLTRGPSTRMQNSMDLEKHGSSYHGAPGQREPIRSVRRYTSDRSGTSDMDSSSPSGSSRVPRSVMLANNFKETGSAT